MSFGFHWIHQNSAVPPQDCGEVALFKDEHVRMTDCLELNKGTDAKGQEIWINNLPDLKWQRSESEESQNPRYVTVIWEMFWYHSHSI